MVDKEEHMLGEMQEKKRTELRAFAQKYELHDDWHEPDGLVVRFVGDHLDNACGEAILAETVRNGGQEYVVILATASHMKHDQIEINLADCLRWLVRAVDIAP